MAVAMAKNESSGSGIARNRAALAGLVESKGLSGASTASLPFRCMGESGQKDHWLDAYPRITCSLMVASAWLA